MNIFLRAAAFSLFLVSASCTTIKREAGYSGGNAGFVADRALLFAKGHKERVASYMVSLTLLAPLITETAQTPTEAMLSAQRINAMYSS